MAVVLDSGALIAFDRGDRAVAALVEAARRRSERFVTSSGCVSQSWRSGGPRQALLARLLSGVEEVGLDGEVSRAVGLLCGKSGLRDVVDAHIAMLANDGDLVLTSDVEDLQQLLRSAKTAAEVVHC